MRYRVKVVQMRVTELELEAPFYDNALVRAEELLQDAEWTTLKIQPEVMKVFGEPTKGDLFREE